MDIILREATTGQLADANVGNLLSFFRLFGRSRRCEFREEDGITRWLTGVSNPWFRGVISARPPRENAPVFIQDMIIYFRSRGVDAFTWWLEPQVKGSEWERLLLDNGLRFDGATPAMSIELARVPASLSAPAGLEIRVVKDIPGLQTWCSTFVRGYGIPEEFADPLYALFEGIGLGFPLRHYLGTLDGEPVGTALLFLAGGVAGIYNVTTLAPMRGRGVGAALTIAPLEEARKLGFQYGVLQSSEMGYNLYQHLGFERVCDLEHYFWSK